MKCCVCKRNVAAGVEAQKMIVEYLQADDSTKIFGFMMSDGPLTKATGRLHRAWHHKCYHAARKRAARGNAVTGRVMAGGPTAYEAAAFGLDPMDEAFLDTTKYSERLEHLHEVARTIGKAVGDLTVLEAYWAEVNHGPYEHGHEYRLEMYQLLAHMRYAHGLDPDEFGDGIYQAHEQIHRRTGETP